MERWIKWLTDAAQVVRAIALLAALIAGAILERVGALPDAARVVPVHNELSSKSLGDKGACPHPQ